jgi:hypothetical protein
LLIQRVFLARRSYTDITICINCYIAPQNAHLMGGFSHR